MRFSELLCHVDHAQSHVPVDPEVVAVSRDSRRVRGGVVWVAIRGGRFDGHDVAGQLRPTAALIERPCGLPPSVPHALVGDGRLALAQVASALHGHPSHTLRVVGVTGTNGKTTITSLCDSAMRSMGVVTGRIGTLGAVIAGASVPSDLTTPEAPELQALLANMRDQGCEAAFCEVSSIGLDQRRVDGTRLHLGVFTNLTRDHLDFHGTMDAYAQSKSRMFRELLREPGGMPRALVCGDDPAWRQMVVPGDRWTYGFSPECDLRIERARLLDSGMELLLSAPTGESVELTCKLVGRHNALNVAAAWGVLLCLGVDGATAARGLSAVDAVPGRLEPVPDAGGRVVLVDYAHTPDALKAALSAVRDVASGLVWVVFGCGGDRDKGKRSEMGEIATEFADHVVVTSDNPRSESPQQIVDDILQNIAMPALVELDRAAAIRWTIQRAGPGDVVVIAGKGHETYQEIGGQRLPFDDRVVARAALEAT